VYALRLLATTNFKNPCLKSISEINNLTQRFSKYNVHPKLMPYTYIHTYKLMYIHITIIWLFIVAYKKYLSC